MGVGYRVWRVRCRVEDLFTADEAGGHALIRDALPEECREIEPPQVRQRLGAPPLLSDMIQNSLGTSIRPYRWPTVGSSTYRPGCACRGGGCALIAASSYHKDSVGPSIRPICTRCCLTMTNMIQVCSKFRSSRVFIIQHLGVPPLNFEQHFYTGYLEGSICRF